MHKKLLYMTIILAMLVGAFGVMGPGGVQPVAAAWTDPFDTIAAAQAVPMVFGDLPYASVTAALTPGSVDAGDPIECGTMQSTQFLELTTATAADVGAANVPNFLHVHLSAYYDAATTPYTQARVGVFESATGVNLACGNFGSDLLVEIDPGTEYLIMVGAPSIAPAPVAGADRYTLVINEVRNDGSLIVPILAAAAADRPGAALNIATADAEAVTPLAAHSSNPDGFNGFLSQTANTAAPGANHRYIFLDVPAGDYNLGVYNRGVAVPWAGIIANATGPGTIPFDADTANIASTVRTNTVANAALGLNVALHPVDGLLFHDIPIGTTAGGPPSVLNFRVAPGVLWDVAGWLDGGAGGVDYFMVKQNYNPLLGDVDFRMFEPVGTHPAVVRQRVDQGAADYRAARIIVDPPGSLNARAFNIFNADLVGNVRVDLRLSPGLDYEALVEIEGGPNAAGTAGNFIYTLMPEIQPFNFPSWVDTNGDGVIDNAEVQYAPIWAQRWGTAPVNFTFLSDIGTTQPEYQAPADVMLFRDGWFDADMNELVRVRILGDTGVALACFTGLAITPAVPARPFVDIAPCDGVRTAMTPLAQTTLLANDWEITDLGPVSDIGRFGYERRLQTDSGAAFGFARVPNYQHLFAISPGDVMMLSHWSWSWVMAMFETGYSTGFEDGTYGPDMVMTRAEMAVFLTRVMSDISTLPAPGAGVGGVFTDVPADYWAAGHIELLADLGITTGYGDGTFGPENPVTRAEMAKFMQLTFRAAAFYGWQPPFVTVDPVGPVIARLWDVNQNVFNPGTTFQDVPMEHWANIWIEELFFDGLTDGCASDQLNLWFCPEDTVTRGQMAKFINSALRPDAPGVDGNTGAIGTIGIWPVLSPER